MSNSLIVPKLYEEHVPRRGYFLLIPWMLIGTVWLRVNTGIDSATVDFYFSLLVAGSLALVIAAYAEPRFNRDLAGLKLLPFILMFGIAMLSIFTVFALISFSGGDWTPPGFNESVFANYIMMTIFLVAPVETLVFQFVVPKLTTLMLANANLHVMGGILSQVTFGLFHYVAYGGSFGAMGMAFMLGVGFYAVVKVSKQWGLGAAMGVHAGWNISVTLFNLSVFAGMLGPILT